MNRRGGFLLLLLTGLGLFAVVHLLFGDSMEDGAGGSGYAGAGTAGKSSSLLGTKETGLEAHGKKPKSAAEIAAEKKAREEAKKKILKSEGVFGKVTDALGKPIAKAAVMLFADPAEMRRRQGAPDGKPIITVETNERGEYVVGPSPPDGYAKVRAEAKGFAPTVKRVRMRGSCVDLILDRGGALKIKTLDHKGDPVAGATVVHQAGNVVTVATTGEGGLALFEALPTGTGTLLVTMKGYGAVRDGNVAVAPGETEERTLVLPQGIEIAGTVVSAEDERPIQGAAVAVRYPQLHTLEEEPPVLTDEEGRFKLIGYVSGSEQMSLRVTKEEYAEARVWRNAQSKGDVTVKLQTIGEALEGRVVSADRQPVSGVRVTYAWMQNEKQSEIPESKTDEDGLFTIKLPGWAVPNSSWTVLAISDADGIGTGQARVPKKNAGRSRPLEIKLGGTGSVSGKVTDAGAQPVQGAVVSLAPDWNAGRNRPGRERVPWQLLRLIHDGQHHNLSAVTGMDGTYTIADVPALDYKVTAAFGLDQFTRPEAVTVTGGGTAEANISLGEGGTIQGWILDSDDKPIAGAYVSANPKNRRGYNWWRNRPSARSQSDGKFVLRGVTDETYDLWANASGYGSAQEKNVSKGDADVKLRLKARGWIQGIVYLDGKPYAGMFTVTVKRKSNSRGPSAPWAGWSPGQQTRTFNTDDGKFQVKGLNAGEYTVQAKTNDGLIALQEEVVAVVDGRGSREVRLELYTGSVVSGMVRDDETGRGIPNAWIYANPKPGQSGGPAPNGWAQSDSRGHYEIKGLGSGPYTISAWIAGTQVSEVIDLQTSEKRSHDVVKRAPGSVQIHVTDEQGNPIEGARPNLRMSTGQWVNVNISQMRKDGLIEGSYDWRTLWNTASDGVLMRYHVPPGVVEVWASKSGYVMEGQHPQVEVRTGSVTQVSITLKKKTP